MGYGVRPDLSSGKKINLDRVYQEIIKPVVTECGYECIRGDEVLDSGLIDESMYYGILESDLVVADISTLNPNAIYELGVRHGVRRFRTIIMMETGDKFFFDLNHSRTLTYTYFRRKDTFGSEAEKVKERLKGIIQNIEANEQVDSPLYTFVNDLQEPQRAEASRSIKTESKPIYERISEASNLRRKEHYAEAYAMFEALSKDIPSDPYFRQQLALCTYKQDESSIELLDKAYRILEPIAETVDPETNGLIGAIFKRRFEITKAKEDINKAVNSYKKAYNIYADNYNGENYAFCLLLAASVCTDKDQKIEFKILSRHIYREVFDANKDFFDEEINTDYEKWILASLAASAKVLNKIDLYEKYEGQFLSKADNMMKSSYRQQMEQLTKLLNS
jgi:hypothetical protein